MAESHHTRTRVHQSRA